ncbi:MAG: 4-vinyl reductase [Candidatus Thermoplasmatota archaeon]|jgi:hypothetical protein
MTRHLQRSTFAMAAVFPQGGVESVAADASILLLVGGLSMLSFIVVLVLLQNLVPARGAAQGLGPTDILGRQLRPLVGAPAPVRVWARGRRRSKAGTPARDRALSCIVEFGIGEPRLLRALDQSTRLRLYGCPCTEAMDRGGHSRPGCPLEEARVYLAFTSVYHRAVVVRETACLRRGDAACEFEVDH